MAAPPIYNPMIPCVHPIPGGLFPGRMLRVQGSVPPGAQRFAINLQCGPNTDPRDDIALHLNFRFVEQCVVRNHLTAVNWGVEDTSGGMPLRQGEQFEALVLTEHNSFKIALNGSHFCEFPHRVPFQRISHITVDGDAMVQLISFEGAQAPPPQSYMPEQQAFGAYGAPPPAYGAPAYGAPQGYVGGPPDPDPPPPTADTPRPDQPPTPSPAIHQLDHDVSDNNLGSSHLKPELDKKSFKTKEVESCSKHSTSVHDIDRLKSQKKLSKSGHSLIPSKSTVAVLKSPSQDREKEAVSNTSSVVYSNSEFSIPSTLKVGLGLDQYSFLDKYSYSYLNAYEPPTPETRPQSENRKPRVQIVINSETELIKESNLDLHDNKSSATLLPNVDSRVIKTEDFDLQSYKGKEFDIGLDKADNAKELTNPRRESDINEINENVNIQETVEQNPSNQSGCQPSSIMLYSQPSGGVQPPERHSSDPLQTNVESQMIAVPENNQIIRIETTLPPTINHNQTGLLLHSPVVDINQPLLDTGPGPGAAQPLPPGNRTSPLKFNQIRPIEQPRREPSHQDTDHQEDSTQKDDNNSKKTEDNSQQGADSGKQESAKQQGADSGKQESANQGGSKQQDIINIAEQQTIERETLPQKQNTNKDEKAAKEDASKQQNNSDKDESKQTKEREQEGASQSQVPQMTQKSQSHLQLPTKSALKRDSVSIPRGGGGVHIQDDSTTSTVSAHTHQPSGILKTPAKEPTQGSHDPTPANKGSHDPTPANKGSHDPTPANKGSHDPAPANKGTVKKDSHSQDSKTNIRSPSKSVEHPTMLKDLIDPILATESESVHKLKRAETINAFDAKQLQMNSSLKLEKCEKTGTPNSKDSPHTGSTGAGAHRKDRQTGCCLIV